MNDNQKVPIGSSNDLQLYHYGNNSYIEDAGTGSLILKTGRVSFNDTSNNEMGRFDGEGLKFNGDTAAANGLDDYEEGTYTPTLSNGPSISSESGRYIKIGKVVHVWWAFTTASDGPSSHVYLNLPFSLTSTNPPCGGTAWDYRTKTVFAHVSQGTSRLYFYDVDSSWLAGNHALIEGEEFRGCTTYQVA